MKQIKLFWNYVGDSDKLSNNINDWICDNNLFEIKKISSKFSDGKVLVTIEYIDNSI